MAGWRDDARVESVLEDADVLHLAVTTAAGVHVTPTVFSMEGGHPWLVVPRRSVKARAVAHSPRVGGLAQSGGRSVLFSGRARIVDPLSARGVLSPGRLLALPLAAAGYLDRNGRHGVGVAKENAVPTFPLTRVAVEIKVRCLALLEEDGALSGTWGGWDTRGLLLTGDLPPVPAVDLTGVPARVRGLVADGSPAVLGWPTCSGPLPFPARCDKTGAAAVADAEAMALAGAWSAGDACLTVSRTGRHLDDKIGLLARGPGRARHDGRRARAGITPTTVTYWVGDDATTIALRRAR